MAFTRWLRSASEKQLLTAAQAVVAKRYGVVPPPRPTGVDVFWRQVFAPIYHRLPWTFRAKIVTLLPGSHRRKWTRRAPTGGPAV